MKHFVETTKFSHTPLKSNTTGILSSELTFYAIETIIFVKKINKVNLSLNQWPRLYFASCLSLCFSLRLSVCHWLLIFISLLQNDENFYIKSICENVIFVVVATFHFISGISCCFDMEINSKQKPKHLKRFALKRVIGV